MHANGDALKLAPGSRVAVIGGGPAGSFFSYFLLDMARTMGLELQVDIYEPRDFRTQGPGGCNMCGGIVSESLVQNLATEGIQLSDTVQRSIDSYFLHMDVGNVRIRTPQSEHRIASVHRGGGPRGGLRIEGGGLDGYLLDLAVKKGARHIRERVDSFSWDEERRPRIKPQTGNEQTYDVACVAAGVNSSVLKLFEAAGIPYKAPPATKTYICEFCFGREMITRELGTSMHVFLLNIPRLEFAALVPKGDYVTLCLLGKDIDKDLVREFLQTRAVKECLPANWQPPPDFCHCSPKISVGSAFREFGDRIVFVGDCGTTRLYKDGIGAAYRTAKAAARTCVFHGIAARDFRRHYDPVCRKIERDNLLGKLVFAVTRQIQSRTYARRALWRMVAHEQLDGKSQRMSQVLWDTFTGSAPYKAVLLRTLHPSFLAKLSWNLYESLRHGEATR
ncbi:MAG: NAD(P)/FAD-dependent oxidoreductase [Terriglobales bacterium]